MPGDSSDIRLKMTVHADPGDAEGAFDGIAAAAATAGAAVADAVDRGFADAGNRAEARVVRLADSTRARVRAMAERLAGDLAPLSARLDSIGDRLDKLGPAARQAAAASNGINAPTNARATATARAGEANRPAEAAVSRATLDADRARLLGELADRLGTGGRRGGGDLIGERAARAELEGQRQLLARRARDLGGVVTGSRTLAEDAAGRRIRERDYELPGGRRATLRTDEQRGRAGLTFGDPAREAAELDDRIEAIGRTARTTFARVGGEFDTALRPAEQRLDSIRTTLDGLRLPLAPTTSTTSTSTTATTPRTTARPADQQAINLRLGATDAARRLAADDVVERTRRAADQLAQRGFRPTASRTTTDARGSRRTIDFADAAGTTAKLDSATGRLTERLRAVGPAGSRSFGRLDRSADDSRRRLLTVRDAAVTIAAGLVAIDRGASILKRALVDPFVGAGRAIVEATEDARAFEIGLSGVAGGLGRARDISRQLTAEARSSSLTLAQVRESTTALARIPALAGRVSGGTAGQAANEGLRFANLAARLGVADPEQGTAGALVALREQSEGDGVSLKRRFGYSQQQLARLTRRSVEDIKNDPALALEGIERLVDILIPQAVLDQQQALISVRVQKLKDYASEALARIGESGVFDSSVNRLEQLGLGAIAYLDSPEFSRDAGRVSASLDRTLGNVSDAVQRFLRSVSGTSGDTSTISGAADAAASGIERLAAISDAMPAALDHAGVLLGEAASRIGAMIDAIVAIGDAARDPSGYAGSAGSGAYNRYIRNPGNVGLDANTLTIEALRSFGVRTGEINREVYDPKTTGDTVYAQRRAEGAGFLDATGEAVAQSLRDMTGRTQLVQTLDLSSLPPELQIAATRLQADFADDGRADPALLTEVRQIALLVARGLPVPRGLGAAGPRVSGATDSTAGDRATLTGRGTLIPASVAAVLAEEGTGGPNFGASLQASMAALSRLGGEQQADPLRDLAGSADRVLGSNIGGTASPVRLDAVFDRIGQQFDDRLAILERAVTEGEASLRGVTDPELRGYVDAVREEHTRLIAAHADAVTLAASGYTEAARGVGRQLSELLADVPYSSGMQEQIAGGAHDFANKIAGVLDRAGVAFDRAADLGFDSLPLDERQAFVRRTTEGRQRDLESFGRTGELRAGLSEGQIALAFRNRPSDRQVAALREQSIREQALPSQGAILRDANTAYSADPTNPAAFRDSAVAVRDYSELLALSQQLQQEADPFRESWVRAASDVRQSLDSGLGDAFTEVIRGTGSVRDAVSSMLADIGASFARMAAQNLLQSVIGDFGTTNRDGGTNGLGGSLLGSVVGNLFGGGVKAAEGGVFSGFTPLSDVPRFGAGGVVTKPTLGLIGDHPGSASIGSPEAVVPLSRGRSIPVELTGPRYSPPMPSGVDPATAGAAAAASMGAGARSYIVVKDEAEAVARGYEPTKDDIVRVVSADLAKGGQIYRAMRRKDGR